MESPTLRSVRKELRAIAGQAREAKALEVELVEVHSAQSGRYALLVGRGDIQDAQIVGNLAAATAERLEAVRKELENLKWKSADLRNEIRDQRRRRDRQKRRAGVDK